MDNTLIQLNLFESAPCKLSYSISDVLTLADMMYMHELARNYRVIVSVHRYTVVFYGKDEDLSNLHRRICESNRDINSVTVLRSQ